MAAPTFADLGKAARDVLYGGKEGAFQFNTVASFASKTSDGVELALKAAHKDGALGTDLKATYAAGGYSLVADLRQASPAVALAASYKGLAPGLTLGVAGALGEADAAKRAPAKATAEYAAPHVWAKAGATLAAAPRVDAAAVVSTELAAGVAALGVETGFDAGTGALTGWRLGGSWAAADYSAAAVLTDRSDLTVYVAHAVARDLTLGLEAAKNVASEGAPVRVAAGVARRLPSGALQKARADSAGVVALLHEQALDGPARVTLSASVDTKAAGAPPKYGCAFDFRY